MYISRRETLCYSALFLFTMVWAGAFSLLGLDLHHDGIMFKAAVDAAAGKWVFKETFCQYGILSPLLQGAMIRLFGAELAVLKLGTTFFYALIVILNDLLWRRFLSLPYRILNAVMFFVLAPYLLVTFHIWSSVYALFFMMAGSELMLLAEEKKKNIFLFFAGVCAMLAFGFRWPCGVVMLAAEILVLLLTLRVCGTWKERRSGFAALLSGAGTVILVFALYLTAGNAWQDMYLQIFSFVGKFAWERGGSGSFQQLLTTFLPSEDTINLIFIVIPLSTLGMFIFSCRGIFSEPESLKKDLPLITLLLFGLASYHQYYPVPCVRHLFWGALPMFGAYVLLLRRIAEKDDFKKIRKIFFLILLFIPLVWGGFWRLYGGYWRISEFFSRQQMDLPGVRCIRLARGEKFVCSVLHEHLRSLSPELLKRGVFNYTADGIWSVILPESPGFDHPMFVNWGNSVYPDYQAKALEHISKKLPIVLTSKEFFHVLYIRMLNFQYRNVDYFIYIPRW